MMKIFTNSPYFPQGSFTFPFFDVPTLSGGASMTKSVLSQLHLHWLLLYSSTQVNLPKEKEGNELTVMPFIKEALWKSTVENHCLSPLVLLSILTTSPHSTRDEHSQTNGALDFGVALKQWQMVPQARSQLTWELLHEQVELAEKQENQLARM